MIPALQCTASLLTVASYVSLSSAPVPSPRPRRFPMPIFDTYHTMLIDTPLQSPYTRVHTRSRWLSLHRLS